MNVCNLRHLVTSRSKDSVVAAVLGIDAMAFSRASALGSTFWAGLATIPLASTWLVTGLGSRLRAGFGVGAGLGCRFGKGFVSALLDGLLISTLFSDTDGARSWTDGALSGLSSEGLGSGVTALEGTLEVGRGASSSSGEMRLFFIEVGAARVTSGAFTFESNFCRGLISRSEPCSFLLL